MIVIKIKILGSLNVKIIKRQTIDLKKMSGKKNLVKEVYPEYVKNSQNSIGKKKKSENGKKT